MLKIRFPPARRSKAACGPAIKPLHSHGVGGHDGSWLTELNFKTRPENPAIPNRLIFQSTLCLLMDVTYMRQEKAGEDCNVSVNDNITGLMPFWTFVLRKRQSPQKSRTCGQLSQTHIACS